MNRIAAAIILFVLITSCTPGAGNVPFVKPGIIASPTTDTFLSPTAIPTIAVPSPTVYPSLTATLVVTPPCRPLKIMPLGDSITYGEGILPYGGYRNLLSALLEGEGAQFDFVGSQKSGDESLTDPDNEGHSGWRISNIRDGIDEEGWLETYQPDIILLHIGSNDLRHGHPEYAIGSLSTLLDDILTRLPETHVILAAIIRTRWGSDVKHVNFNNAIPGIAALKGEQVSVVAMQEILSEGDFTTLYHPSPVGYDKMAHAWMKAILALNIGKCIVP
jgi:lysophospholipase L1-like esterase